MSERSEFGLRAPLPEKRRGPPRLYRGGSRPAKGLFGSFLVLQKGTRTRKRAKAVHLLLFGLSKRSKRSAKNRASALFARLTFVLSKVSKTAIAGHSPMR